MPPPSNDADAPLGPREIRVATPQGVSSVGLVVTAPASYHWPYDYATVAFLRQCGCTVEHIELENTYLFPPESPEIGR